MAKRKRTEMFRVGLAQFAMSGEAEANEAKAVAAIRSLAERGAEIACLPELFRGPYFCQYENADLFDLAEPIPGPTTEAMGKLARETGVVVLASVFERRAPGLCHNSLALIERTGELVGLYRKMHIPHDPLFYEKYYFTPGDTGFKAVETSVAKVGMLVCWDQWFPEAARLTALAGAEILFYPTAIAWMPSEKPTLGEAQLDAWRTAQRAHAIANGVFVAAVNRVGIEGDLEFWGRSFVADPLGRVLAEAGEGEEIVLVDCRREEREMVRRDWPFLRDRRIDAYGPITERFLD